VSHQWRECQSSPGTEPSPSASDKSSTLAVPLSAVSRRVPTAADAQGRHLVQHGVIRGLAEQRHEQSDAKAGGSLALEVQEKVDKGSD